MEKRETGHYFLRHVGYRSGTLFHDKAKALGEQEFSSQFGPVELLQAGLFVKEGLTVTSRGKVFNLGTLDNERDDNGNFRS